MFLNRRPLSLNINNINILCNYFFKIMDENDLSLLTRRLEAAEENLKLINKEIIDIKAKILLIQTTGISLSGTRSARQYLVGKRIAEQFSSNDVTDNKRLCHNFQYVDEYVIVYTDGACENNGKPGAKAGIGVWFQDNHPLNVSKPVIGKATNNVAEIQACIAAIQLAIDNNINKLCIRTDSQFVINSMTIWIKKWKKNNWKVVNGNDVKNKEDFVILDALCQKLNVKWEYVKGHSNNYGNEAADALARAGALEYKKN